MSLEADKKKLIGNVIREGRNKRSLTQRDVSEITGISRSYLSDIETGRYMPSVNTLIQLASLLDLDLNFLLKMTEIQVKRYEKEGEFT